MSVNAYLLLVRFWPVIHFGNSPRNPDSIPVLNSLFHVRRAIVEKKVEKKGRLWTLPDKGLWVGHVHKFYDRECYDYNIQEISKEYMF